MKSALLLLARPAAGICVFLLVCLQSWGQPAKFEDLKGKYPWDVIYIMHRSLLEMKATLHNPAAINDLKSRHDQRTFDLLKSFLKGLYKDGNNPEFVHAVAFLAVNLHAKQAGYKCTSDTRPELEHIAWNQKDVEKIALFCDEFLLAQASVEEVRVKIQEGKLSIAESWKQINALERNPLVSRMSISTLLPGFLDQLNKKPQEIEKIKLKNRTVHREIETFQKKAEQSLQKWQGKLSWSDKAFQIVGTDYPKHVLGEIDKKKNSVYVDVLNDFLESAGKDKEKIKGFGIGESFLNRRLIRDQRDFEIPSIFKLPKK